MMLLVFSRQICKVLGLTLCRAWVPPLGTRLSEANALIFTEHGTAPRSNLCLPQSLTQVS